jgi:hypothetical protein
MTVIPERPGGLRRLRRAIPGAKFLVLIEVVELMVGGCGQQPDTGAQASFVAGTVSAGPVIPVERVGRPNTRPLAGATVEAFRGGDVVAAARSDDRGRYRLTVRPGTYLIRVMPPGRFLWKEPDKTVTVPAGETVTVNFLLDTGIR